METAIQLQGVRFGYGGIDTIIDIADFTVNVGEKVFVHGASGSGKSTLLGLIAGILRPEEGTIRLFESDLSSLRSSARDRFRGEMCGYIFQMFNLLPYLTVEENIALVCKMSRKRRERLGTSLEEEVNALAEQLGIKDHLHKKVTDLSIGQQQRVAAARAFLGSPPLIIADEPTSALDHDNREEFIKTLFQMAEKENTTIVFVSHDHTLSSLFDRGINLAEINNARKNIS